MRTEAPKSKNMKETQVANLILIRDGKVLVLKEQGKDVYSLPGGEVEQGETIEEGLAREVREELDCKVANPRFFNETRIPGWNKGEVYRSTYFVGDIEGQFVVSGEMESFAWVGKEDLENQTIKLHPHTMRTKIMEDLIVKGLVN